MTEIDDAEDVIDQELESFLSNWQLRGYYLAVVAASVTASTLMFNLGAYNVVFFRTLFAVWVTCTAIFLGTFVLPRAERPIKGWELWALLAPSLWVFALIFAPAPGEEASGWYSLLETALTLIIVLSLPYIGYVLLVITQGEALRLPLRMLIGLVVIVLVTGSLGYWAGNNNFLFMTCHDFVVAGDFAPANCLPSEAE